jgi:hypothetical protein
LDLSFQTKDISGINIVISRCDASQRSVIEKAKTMRTELLANQK